MESAYSISPKSNCPTLAGAAEDHPPLAGHSAEGTEQGERSMRQTKPILQKSDKETFYYVSVGISVTMSPMPRLQPLG
jgi:hypothetical protein